MRRQLTERVYTREWLARWGSLLMLIAFQVFFTGRALLQSTCTHYRETTEMIVEGKTHTYYHSEEAEIGVQLIIMMAVLIMMELILFTLFTRRSLAAAPVLVPLFLLLTISLILQTYVDEPGESFKHLVFILLGLVVLLAAMRLAKFSTQLHLSIRILEMIPIAALVICIPCTIYGILHPINGSGAWVRIAGVQVQPGEFFKVYMLAYLGLAFVQLKSSRTLFWLFLGTSAAICGSLLVINDTGNAIIMAVLLLIIFYVLQGWKKLAAIVAAGSGAMAVVLWILFAIAPRCDPESQVAHIVGRLQSTTWSLLTQPGGSSNLRRGLLAMVRGGILGTGLEDSHYATANFASNCDFAYSVLVSIFGAGIGLLIAGCFVELILSGRMSLKQSGQNLFLFHYSNIVLSVLAVQALVHIGGNLNLLPFTGVVLPFVSAGGSNMLSSCLCVGIALGGKLPDKTRADKRRHVFRGGKEDEETWNPYPDDSGVYPSGAVDFGGACGTGGRGGAGAPVSPCG